MVETPPQDDWEEGMSFGFCPRCGTQSLERFRTHTYCFDCNYCPELSPFRDLAEEAPVPDWIFSIIPELSPSVFDRPPTNGAAA